MTSTLHIDTLISNIKKEFATKPDPSQSVRALLEDYVSSGYDDWRQYAFFNPHKYCRNLLEFNEDFELIVLCWEPNQESPIHNHSGQHCWMAVLDGDMREVHYHSQPDPSYPERVLLTEDGTSVYHKGQVAYIHDEIALHKVRPDGEFRCCTLHMYSKPIPMANLYCPITGKVTQRKMGFYSRRGVKVDCEKSACTEYIALCRQYIAEQPAATESEEDVPTTKKAVSEKKSTPCKFSSYLALLMSACAEDINAAEHTKQASMQ